MSKRGFKVLDSSSEEESDEYTDSPIEQIGTSVLKNVHHGDDLEGYEPSTKKRKTTPVQNLDNMKRKLFDKVCSGTDIDFKEKMTKKDTSYIKSISSEIEQYIDLLANEIGNTDITTNFKIKGCPEGKKKQCDMLGIGKESCMIIPGYYKTEKISNKQFIPQLYHVLQDYGFFFEYLQFPAIIDTIPRLSCGDISRDWAYRLGSITGVEEHQNGIVGKKQLLKKMMLRIRRVQFLREFDVVCCLAGTTDKDHEYFSEHVLKPVYETLERDYNRITV